MKTSLAVVVAALTLVGHQSALAQSRRQALPIEGVITNPDWESMPTGELMAQYFPPFAQAASLSGYAVISCQVTNLGRLENCTSKYERPAMIGFGQAALSLSREFKMKPKTLDGVPVAGGVVNIPITFAFPKPANPNFAGPAAQPSPGASAAVRDILDLIGGKTTYQNNLVQVFDKQTAMMQAMSEPPAPEAQQQIRTAVERSAAAAASARYNAYMQAYLDTFSEKELADIAAFMKTPSGKAFATRQNVLVQAIAKLSDTPVVQESFAREFCSTVECFAPQGAAARKDQEAKP